MNVTITEDPRLADIEVAVSCPRIDERVQRIVAGLNAFERKLTGERDGATYRLDIDGICYVETVDGRTFLYTEDAVYRTPLRLYELEDKLAGTGDYSDLMVIPDLELSVEEYGIGFRQGSDLTAAVNQAMQELIDDGTLNELAVKYELADLLLANQ